MSKGKCIIFSAPSGSGKTTLVNYLVDQNDLNLIFSISATTRKKRDTERKDVDYIFLSKDNFEKKQKRGEFLEYEEVYKGVFYGTLKQSVNDLLKNSSSRWNLGNFRFFYSISRSNYSDVFWSQY